MAVLTPIIFIHELGHFIFARFFGVKVEVFSIGFGKSLIEWQDGKGTIWKIAMIPLGGYVRMLGDKDPSSTTNKKEKSKLTELDKKNTFYVKKLWQKAMIAFAGPLANYLFTLIIFTGIYFHYGMITNKTIITQVENDSPAHRAGLQSNDEITDINGTGVKHFQQLIFEMSLIEEKDISLGIMRLGEYKKFNIIADFIETKNTLGKIVSIPKIGVYFQHSTLKQIGLFESFKNSIEKTYTYTYMMLRALSGIFSSKKEIDVMGAVGIAKMSKQFGEEAGWLPILSFIAIISLNLGLINLLPIPTLDGGHLLFYLIEGVMGRTIDPKLQNLFFKVGLVIIVILMSTALWNDFKLIKNG